jgi:hypothetical protein
MQSLSVPSQQTTWAIVIGLALGLACIISPLLAIGMVVGVFGAFLALWRPMLMLYLAVAGTVFFSGMPRGELVPLFIPNEPLLVLSAGVSFFIVLIRQMPRGQQMKIEPKLVISMIILGLGTAVLPLVTYRMRNYPMTTGEIFGILAPLQYIVVAWLFAYLPVSDRQRYKLVQWMLFCGSFVALIGLLQAANIGPVKDLLNTYYPSIHTENAEDAGRVTSVLGAWNSLGNFLMINLLILLAIQPGKHSRLYKMNMLYCATVDTLCLLASGSFASLGGFVAGVALIMILNGRGVRMIIILFLMMLMGVLVLRPLLNTRLEYQFSDGGLVPQTLRYRFKVWNDIYIPVISKDPWWGIRPSMRGLSWTWAESHYLFLMFRAGVFALFAHLIWTWMLGSWLFGQIRQRREYTLHRALCLALFTSLIVLSVMGLTNEVFTSSGAIDYLWIMVGLVARSKVQHEQQEQSAAESAESTGSLESAESSGEAEQAQTHHRRRVGSPRRAHSDDRQAPASAGI